jgi:hypothetical protein
MYRLLHIPTGECVIFDESYAGDIDILKPQALVAACEHVYTVDKSKCVIETNYEYDRGCIGCPWFIGEGINKAEYLFEIYNEI